MTVGDVEASTRSTVTDRRSSLFIMVPAIAKILFHPVTNHQYGFRDELAMLDDAPRAMLRIHR
jgi:hypothetical protein